MPISLITGLPDNEKEPQVTPEMRSFLDGYDPNSPVREATESLKAIAQVPTPTTDNDFEASSKLQMPVEQFKGLTPGMQQFLLSGDQEALAASGPKTVDFVRQLPEISRGRVAEMGVMESLYRNLIDPLQSEMIAEQQAAASAYRGQLEARMMQDVIMGRGLSPKDIEESARQKKAIEAQGAEVEKYSQSTAGYVGKTVGQIAGYPFTRVALHSAIGGAAGGFVAGPVGSLVGAISTGGPVLIDLLRHYGEQKTLAPAVGAAIGTAAGGPVGTVTGFSMGLIFDAEAGNAFSDLRELKDSGGNTMPLEYAAVGALVAGAINTTIEGVTIGAIGKMVQKVPGITRLFSGFSKKAIVGMVGMSLRDPSVIKEIGKVVGTWGFAGLAEANQELWQYVFPAIVTSIAKNQSDKFKGTQFGATSPFEDLNSQEAWTTFRDTLVGSLALGALPAGAAIHGTRAQVEAAKSYQTRLDALKTAFDESTHLPEGKKAWAEKLLENETSVWMDANDAETLFQSSPDLMLSLGLDAKQVTDAAASGDVIRVNLGKVLVDTSSAEYKQISKFFKVSPEALSANDAEKASSPESVSRAVDLAAESIDEAQNVSHPLVKAAFENFKKKLENAGQLTEEAAHHITLVDRFTRMQIADGRPAEEVAQIWNAMGAQIVEHNLNGQERVVVFNPNPSPVSVDPGEIKPAEPVSTPKEKIRRMSKAEILSASPVISAIRRLGGLVPKSRAETTGGEYDDAISLQESAGMMKEIYGGKEKADRMAQILFDEGVISAPDVSEMWRAIRSELFGATKQRETEAQQQAWIESQRRWEQTGSELVSVSDLNPGDVYFIQGQRFEEGEQTEHPTEKIRIDKGSLVKNELFQGGSPRPDPFRKSTVVLTEELRGDLEREHNAEALLKRKDKENETDTPSKTLPGEREGLDLVGGGDIRSDEQGPQNADAKFRRDVEEKQQVAQLRENQGEQRIVTIGDAVEWLKTRGLFPEGKERPGDAVAKMVQHPDFAELSVFDRLRLVAQLQRVPREHLYAGVLAIRGQNRKTENSPIWSADTVRGCDQNCLDCYSNLTASQGQIRHQTPVKCELKGVLTTDKILRIGTNGEPSKDWVWTNEQVRALIDRSKVAGHDVSIDKNVFFITKLLDLTGFDPAVAKNLEVSIDPIYPAHMRATFSNVVRVLQQYPNVNIVLRIRSFKSDNVDLNRSLQAAVDFARALNIPVLETRMRFKSVVSGQLMEIQEDKYKMIGSPRLDAEGKQEMGKSGKPLFLGQSKLKSPVLRGKLAPGKWAVCDESDTGKCDNCLNCKKLMVDDREKNIQEKDVSVLSPMEPVTLDVRGQAKLDEQNVTLFQGGRELDAHFSQTRGVGFYSVLDRFFLSLDFKEMPASDLLGKLEGTQRGQTEKVLKVPGLKREEVDDIELIDWLQGMGSTKVTKDQVVKFIQDRGPRLSEVVRDTKPPVLVWSDPFTSDGNTIWSTNIGRKSFVITRLSSNGKFILDQGAGMRSSFDTLEAAQEDAQRAAQNYPAQNAAKYQQQWSFQGGSEYREFVVTIPERTSQISDEVQALEDFRKELQTKHGENFTNADLSDVEYDQLRQLQNAALRSESKRQVESGRLNFLGGKHFPETNIIFHFRVQTFIDESGKRVLHIEEIQGDWTQAYRDALKARADLKALAEKAKEQGVELLRPETKFYPGEREALLKIGLLEDFDKAQKKVRDNPVPAEPPFKKSWETLAFKRVLRLAAEEGFDRVTWTTGDQQTIRYNEALADVVKIEYVDGILLGYDIRGQEIFSKAVEEDKLGNWIGEDKAEKLLEMNRGYASDRKKLGDLVDETRKDWEIVQDKRGRWVARHISTGAESRAYDFQTEAENYITSAAIFEVQESKPHLLKAEKDYPSLTGDDLKITDAGMVAAYDKRLVNIANDIGKKFGTKTGETTLQDEQGRVVHSLDIPEAMREQFLKDVPLYQPGNAPDTNGHLGSTKMVGNSYLISLFQGKYNKSTLLHELGHVFMLETQAWIATGKASTRTIENWNAILEWLGLEKGTVLSIQDHRAQMEKFALGFEAYLREGKAPSSSLKKAFAAFRSWLVRVYKSVKALWAQAGTKVQLDAGVRRAFDKMLADDDEIEQAVGKSAILFSEKELDAMGVSEADKAYLRKLQAQAMEEGKAKLQERRAKNRRIRISSERKAVKVMAEQEPVFMLRDDLAEAPLDAALVREAYGDVIADELMKQKAIAEDTGRSPGQTAADYGFSSEQDMIESLVSAPSRTAWIKQEVERRMAEYDAQYDASQEFLDTEEAHEYLRVVSVHLEKKANPNRASQIQDRIIRQAAVKRGVLQKLDSMPLRDAIQVDRFLAQFRSWSKKSRDAIAKKNFRGALEANQKVRFLFETIRQSRKLKQAMGKAERGFSKALKSKTIDIHYQTAMVNLGRDFGLTTKTMDPTDKLSLFDLLRPGIDQENSPWAIPPIFSDFLFTPPADGKPRPSYKDLSTSQARELFNALLFLEKQGRKIATGALNAHKMTLDEALIQLAGALQKLPDNPVGEEGSVLRAVKEFSQGYLAPAEIMQYIFLTADGSKPGPHTELIWNKLGERWSAKAGRLRNLKEQLQPIIDRMETRAKEVDLSKLPVPYLFRADGRKWTWQRIMGLALQMGNVYNADAVLNGYECGSAEIQSILRKMIARDWQDVQAIWDLVDSLWPDLKKAYERINIIAPPKVIADPLTVKTADGKTITLRGGYFPLKFDGLLALKGGSQRVGEWDEKADFLAQVQASFPTPHVPAGYMQDRKGPGGLPPALDFGGVLAAHLDMVTNYIYLADILGDSDKMLRGSMLSEYQKAQLEKVSPLRLTGALDTGVDTAPFLERGPKGKPAPIESQEVRASRSYPALFVRKFSTPLYKQLRPWLAYIANGRSSVKANALDRASAAITSMGAAQALSGKLGTALKQITGVVGFFNDPNGGPTRYFRGLEEFFFNPALIYEVNKLSPGVMDQRWNAFDPSIREILVSSGIDKMFGEDVLLTIRSMAMLPMNVVDSITTYPTWLVTYREELAKHGDAAKAIQAADSIVVKHQPSSRPMDVSGYQRDAKGITGWAIMFSGWKFKFGSKISFNYRGLTQGTLTGWDAARFAAIEWILPVVAAKVLITSLRSVPKGPPPPDKETMSELALDAFSSLVGGIPIFGDIAQLSLKKALGKPFTEFDSPAIRVIDDMVKSIGAIFESLSDPLSSKGKAAIWALAEIASLVLRVPAARLYSDTVKGFDQARETGEWGRVFLPGPKEHR